MRRKGPGSRALRSPVRLPVLFWALVGLPVVGPAFLSRQLSALVTGCSCPFGHPARHANVFFKATATEHTRPASTAGRPGLGTRAAMPSARGAAPAPRHRYAAGYSASRFGTPNSSPGLREPHAGHPGMTLPERPGPTVKRQPRTQRKAHDRAQNAKPRPHRIVNRLRRKGRGIAKGGGSGMSGGRAALRLYPPPRAGARVEQDQGATRPNSGQDHNLPELPTSVRPPGHARPQPGQDTGQSPRATLT